MGDKRLSGKPVDKKMAEQGSGAAPGINLIRRFLSL